ncbi:hypothetical protein [Collinsella sp. An271]|uniref:hypothetical protein n=1 Tax=Collinsella sp. An271 TaxID=1965616 RepID=UPI000B395B62|nr:hypothetical protein [Collinsella sp. An271]
MDDDIRSENNANLAGPRYEPPGQEHEKNRNEGIERNGDGEGRQNYRREISPSNGEEIDELYEDASAERRAEIIASRYWSGILPPPDEFNQYPIDVQKMIVEWADESQKAQNAIVKSAIELDKAESKRLDDASDTDASQIVRAQRGTIALNAMLIIGAVILGALGQAVSCGALIGGLAVINVATLYASKNKDEGDARDGKQDS